MKNLFNFATFKVELLSTEDKCKFIEDYEGLYEPLSDDFKDSFIFKSYINKFKIPNDLLNYLNIPDGFEDYFDLELLIQLVSASFSSSCNFEISSNGKLDLIIAVENYQTLVFESNNSIPITFKQYLESYVKPKYSKNDYENLITKQITPLDLILENNNKYPIIYTVKKVLSNLWTFQVMRLFEIYTEEQINLFTLIRSEPEEAEAICHQQMLRWELYNNNFPTKFESAVEQVTTDKVLDL